MKNTILFSVASLIWGSTWLVIKFQLGVVDPLISVVYRFLLASIILLIFSRLFNLNLRYKAKEHFFMALQGFLLFGITYWFIYLAELSLPSGLVAVVFSTIIFFNILNGALFLKSAIRLKIVIGAFIGFIGMGLVFRQELLTFNLSSDYSLAFLLAITGAFIASLGNITSAYNQKNKMPVIQTNAFGMLYGAIFMLIISLIMGKPFDFEVSFAYISSLLYLAVFGSIVAFGCYLTLIGKIGADKTSYVTLVVPVIALLLSTIFEGYGWSVYALAGVFFILVGNILILRKK